ncbi:hypothetical protein TBLA_0H02970 [Henningerozyma blattae CBS 6284]|uniref:UNC-50 family protein n=1 Tax=Henningerozyma blattae (strain ATCC 34711 / CBS 6284 / DSM 70876 / NBRC 10599 / NRRL Y-10934 / UCD 77-7) TaxID=1071380 RepID=I2H879_HENB6|nr:hypothetical protein TBLA_0H02970 [Tetrapisispora blattae CBS 6284]CCH62581.1 hypothetical protein TBLA_0H02970 [Tetrapisispora blattae CBS 6284]
MSGLPVSIQDLETNRYHNSLPPVLRRLFKTPKNLDFETASWEMVHLIFKPRMAYRQFYYQRQTNKQWARDDPSFFLLQIGLLMASSLIWSIVYGHSVGGFFRMMLNMVVTDFFLFGFTVATIFWFVLNRPMFKFKSAVNSRVEWAYCFDVHCNAFLIIWVSIYFLQFLALPILNMENWFSLVVGNTLYCFAFAHYFILTFYGYSQLTFLKNISFILFPSLFFGVLYIISLVGINVASRLSFYKH